MMTVATYESEWFLFKDIICLKCLVFNTRGKMCLTKIALLTLCTYMNFHRYY